MSRIAFEEMLKRRTSRRLALKAGTAGLIGVSFRGAPTRTFARQSATPKATPIDLTNRPSKTFGAYPFQLGVASGDPFPHSVVLWTRLAPAPYDGGGMDPVPYDVHWEVARDESFKNIVQAGRAVADPNLAHSVHVDVTGLDSYTEYFYRFMVGDEVSQAGRTKTAAAHGRRHPFWIILPGGMAAVGKEAFVGRSFRTTAHCAPRSRARAAVSYTHLRAHE